MLGAGPWGAEVDTVTFPCCGQGGPLGRQVVDVGFKASLTGGERGG